MGDIRKTNIGSNVARKNPTVRPISFSYMQDIDMAIKITNRVIGHHRYVLMAICFLLSISPPSFCFLIIIPQLCKQVNRFAGSNPPGDPKRNEIVLCTVKSEQGSDEIFSLRLQMKLNPPLLFPRSGISSRSDFIHQRWIYSAIGGFI